MSRSRVGAVVRADLGVARRDLEQLLLTLGLPVLLLVFFATVDVLPTGSGEPVDFLTPGILALALLSVAFVRLTISLGFDRGFGAIKRLAVTPLGEGEFLVAKGVVTIALFLVQVIVIGAVALGLGWRPEPSPLVLVAVLLALVAFMALAFVVASVVEGLLALAVANSVYIVLLLFSGIVFELDELPAGLATAVKVLPSTATAELLRSTLAGSSGARWAWLVLASWALLGSVAAPRLFRWS